MATFAHTILALLASQATRANPVTRSATYGDVPYSLSPAQLERAVYCPRGTRGAAGGIVLLMAGTASTGSETWPGSPYNRLLPNAGPGFDICWIDTPDHSLGDMQVTAEYIAWNVPRLAKKSATRKVSVVGHSQGGGLNPQWAFDFWPSTRKYVSHYVSIAGDFHGTAEGPLACLAEDLLRGGCAPSILQQTVGSTYLGAQNQRGGAALVPTTSIYTRTDDIIQPEIVTPTSALPGARNIALQDACGALHLADHFSIIIDPAAYALTLEALTNGAVPFTTADCNFFRGNTALDLTNVPILLRATVLALARLGVAPGVRPTTIEPPLKKYVCEQGQASVCGNRY